VQAQGLPVYDNANFTQNVISAIQSVLTTIQLVLVEANQILELTPNSVRLNFCMAVALSDASGQYE
jgi:conjugal transfer/entry exclusion protein